MMVSTCARSPITARARLARSPVVATTRMFCAGAADDTRNVATMLASAARGTNRARATSGLRGPSPASNEHALGQQAVHVLLGIRDGTDPTIHRDAGKPIGVEARDLLFAFEPLDHAHRRGVHRLVQVGVLRVRDVVLRRLLGRTLHIFTRRLVL